MKEVQFKPGQYTELVKEYSKPYLVIKESDFKLSYNDYVTAEEALEASKPNLDFTGDLLCVYNLKVQQYVSNEVLLSGRTKPLVNDLIAYYKNK